MKNGALWSQLVVYMSVQFNITAAQQEVEQDADTMVACEHADTTRPQMQNDIFYQKQMLRSDECEEILGEASVSISSPVVTSEASIQKEHKHSAHNYHPLPVVFSKALGV